MSGPITAENLRGPLAGATVLLILLRRHLTTAEADSPRVVVTATEMATWLGDYYPDGVSPDKLDGDINQVVKLGYLRRLRGSSDDYEVRRIIKPWSLRTGSTPTAIN